MWFDASRLLDLSAYSYRRPDAIHFSPIQHWMRLLRNTRKWFCLFNRIATTTIPIFSRQTCLLSYFDHYPPACDSNIPRYFLRKKKGIDFYRFQGFLFKAYIGHRQRRTWPAYIHHRYGLVLQLEKYNQKLTGKEDEGRHKLFIWLVWRPRKMASLCKCSWQEFPSSINSAC